MVAWGLAGSEWRESPTSLKDPSLKKDFSTAWLSAAVEVSLLVQAWPPG
jgi:hypothetical protein